LLCLKLETPFFFPLVFISAKLQAMKSISDKIKARIIQLHKEGLSTRKITDQVSVSHSTVARVCRMSSENHQPLHIGRPKILDSHDERYITRLMTTGKCATAVQAQKELQENAGVQVSTQTVRRALRRNGLKARVKHKKPLLGKRHRQMRLRFAQKYKNWEVNDWNQVIWSDETKINLFGCDGKEYCWKKDGEQLQAHHVSPTVKYGGGSVMVWGCMTAQGVGFLCRIDGHLDAALYKTILSDELLKTIDWYQLNPNDIFFQHDNDPKHTARSTKEWLQDQDFKVLDWPSQSPDLNPIEHLWQHIKQQLNKYPKRATRKEELWQRVEEVWEKVEPSFCRKLIDTMPERIKDVIKSKGGYTRW
jgi:transposase